MLIRRALEAIEFDICDLLRNGLKLCNLKCLLSSFFSSPIYLSTEISLSPCFYDYEFNFLTFLRLFGHWKAMSLNCSSVHLFVCSSVLKFLLFLRQQTILASMLLPQAPNTSLVNKVGSIGLFFCRVFVLHIFIYH